MKTADKQKMCSNCHGRIPIEADTCLYCGQEQADAPAADASSQAPLFEQKSLQDSLTSLYSPPYSSKRPSYLAEKEEAASKISRPQATPKRVQEAKRESIALPVEESAVDPSRAEAKGSLFSILLLLLGGNLFALGLMQCFFSVGSRLRLEWQADSWYLYCLVAVPLLFVGYRLASRLK